MKDIRIKSCLAFVIAFATVAHASEHTGYWNEHTPTGDAFKCEEVTSRERMVEVLESAGWNVPPPPINWQRDEAVIVAPNKYYESGYLAFYGLSREDDSIVLKYGWEPIVESTVHGPGSFSIGSSSPGYPATIVVSYKRGLDSNREFFCRDIGLVPR